MKEKRGGDPKKISEILKLAIEELRPAKPSFKNIEYTIPKYKMNFIVGLN